MKAAKLTDSVLFPRSSFSNNKTDTYDISVSTEKFIKQNYRGFVRFAGRESLVNRPVLFTDYDIAKMIKAIIQEVPLEHTSSISFSSNEEYFIISFGFSQSNPPSEESIARLAAEARAQELSISMSFSVLNLFLPIDNSRINYIYSRNRLFFWKLLYLIFKQ